MGNVSRTAQAIHNSRAHMNQFSYRADHGRTYQSDVFIPSGETRMTKKQAAERKNRLGATLFNILSIEKYLSETVPKNGGRPCYGGHTATSCSQSTKDRIIAEYHLVYSEEFERYIGDENEVFTILSQKYTMPKEFTRWPELLYAFKYGYNECKIIKPGEKGEKMKEIDLTLLEIEDITLLSFGEVKNIPEPILKYHFWWWLRSPGDSQCRAALVDYDGSVDYDGYFVYNDYGEVRPALRISNLESFNLEIGDIVGLRGVDVEWVVASDDYLLCNDKSFGYHRFDPKSNDYEKSEIKDYIHKKAEEFGIFPKHGAADDDFGTICICAERYALGRETYMPGIVQDFIRHNINFVDTRAVIVMIKDLTDSPFYGDEVIDKPGWIAFREFLEKELEERRG